MTLLGAEHCDVPGAKDRISESESDSVYRRRGFVVDPPVRDDPHHGGQRDLADPEALISAQVLHHPVSNGWSVSRVSWPKDLHERIHVEEEHYAGRLSPSSSTTCSRSCRSTPRRRPGVDGTNSGRSTGADGS